MEIDINEFKKRLDKEIAGGSSEIGEFIQQEIRLSETMKASLMEEMNETTKDFLNEAASKFDTYIFQLQELEKELNLKNLSLDQKVALNDKTIRRNIADELDELNKIDPEKYPDSGETDKAQE